VTISATVGTRLTPWSAVSLCELGHSPLAVGHHPTRPGSLDRVGTLSGSNMWGGRGGARRVRGSFSTGADREQVSEGTVGNRAFALLAVRAATERCPELAGRSPTVLKSRVGVVSLWGRAPDDGARGINPAPVWRKC
jgi:hypothetical protein